MNHKLLKLLSIALAMSTSLSTLPISAYEIPVDENNNSIETVEYDEHEYLIGNETEEGHSLDTNVYAKIGSSYNVTIPKVIILSGTTKKANYYVSVAGDIAGYEILHVVPDDHFNLYTKNKSAQLAEVIQDITQWRFNEFDKSASGNVSANDITAGKWSGTFNFLIWIEGVDEERVLGDLILPSELDDNYKLLIKKLSIPGIYDEDGKLICEYNDIIAEYRDFDVNEDNNRVSSIINNNYQSARYIVLPETVTRIGNNTFNDTEIKYVKIPDSVTYIGKNAFSEKTIYTNIPKSVKSLASGIKKGYYNNKEIKTIIIDLENNDSVDIELEKGCRYEIIALYNFTNNVTNESTIVSSNPSIVAFTPECFLDAIEVGNCIISGTYYTRDDREKYAEIKVKVKNCESEYDSFPYIESEINHTTLGYLGYVFNGSYVYKNGRQVNVMEIPATYEHDGKVYKFTSVGGYCFGHVIIDEVILPNTIKNIGFQAFTWSSIKTINIPEGVTSISEQAFYNTSELQTATFPSTLKVIGPHAFYGSVLPSCTLPDNIQTVNGAAFELDAPKGIGMKAITYKGVTYTNANTFNNKMQEEGKGSNVFGYVAWCVWS